MTFITGITTDPSRLHKGKERRHSERKATQIRVEIMHPSFGKVIGFTQDLSDGGASVKIDHQAILPMGTLVSVRFFKIVGAINQEPATMEVVHRERNIIGLMFAGLRS